MANILFLPIPEFGHMNPPLKLAKALQRRGHRVYYVGFPDIEDYARSQGIEHISIFEERYPKGYLNARASKLADGKIDRLSLMLLEAREAHDQITLDLLEAFEVELSRVFDIVRPDLFIVDNMLRDLAAMTAHTLGIPTVRLLLSFEEARIGLDRTDHAAPLTNLPVLVLCPKEIDFTYSSRKKNYYYLEASIELERREEHAFPWEDLDESRPLVYCSFGSQCHQYEHSEGLFRAVIEAMREKSDWQLAVAIGPYLKMTAFHPLPSNVLVVNWAPQLQMLERAAIMITHGGLGAIKECIFFGVPMIVFPAKWDQPYNAARVAHHGFGLRGNSQNQSARQVLTLIDSITGNPSFKRRVAAMSKTFREIENSGIGVRTVEELMADFQGSNKPARQSVIGSPAC